ncbi:MAG: DUF402 domain-containing protein [Mycoplasmataceae bacterium]|nr:DUF402 domain-containing protein [Mycoplasmataceae bacterium]
MDITNGQIVNVQAYKHDGTLYRQWNGAKVLEVSKERIVLFLYKTKVAEKSGQKWTVREPMLWWMSREEFRNTTGLIRSSGTHFYTNLASPSIYEDGVVKFIDYDLDIKAYPGMRTKVVDEREFNENKESMKYPQKIIDEVLNTTNRVLEEIQSKEGFFDEDVIDEYIEELLELKLISQKFAKTKSM